MGHRRDVPERNRRRTRNHAIRAYIAAVGCVVMLLSACGGSSDSFEITEETTFEQIVRAARGSPVRFYMWGGDARINNWVDSFVAEEMSQRFDIEVERVAQDAETFVNKLITERQAGRRSGSIDLMWINGENFKNAREADVLFGPFVDLLPNYVSFVDREGTAFDFGYPVDGYEAPYGRAQFVFEYDSALVEPPKSFAELQTWVREHPGRFTYPQPPSFTGSAFVRQVFYAISGGHEQFLDGFDRKLFDEHAPRLWEYLNDIEPFLWQEGTTYPKDKAPLDTMFQRGEVLLNMSYHQADASGRIQSGRYPGTVRTFVMDEGSLFNTHYTAIAYNAPNKPGALVLSNFLMSPDAQYDKNIPERWGDFTILRLDSLSDEDRRRFENLDLGIATLSLEVLAAKAVPEISPEYVEAIEEGWEEHVLRR